MKALVKGFCLGFLDLVQEPYDFVSCFKKFEQAENKNQLYTHIRLLFSNSNISEQDKRLFLKSIHRMDEDGIKVLNDMVGGFTKEHADQFVQKFGVFSDEDELQTTGCVAKLPEWEHKKQVFNNMIN
jgi:hypothetical protein